MSGSAHGPHVLVIVQNLPVPLDRRVWLECRALVEAGYRVSVVCPRGPGDPAHQYIDGVAIHKYRPAPAARGPVGYLWEFAYSWLRTAWLVWRVWRSDRFDALQACNPPDTYWALARLYTWRGVRFVYDQHDLNPEVYRSRFGEPVGLAGRAQYAVLRWLERMTYRTAHQMISTNESYRAVALRRGGVDPGSVTVVRSGPDTNRMRPEDGDPALREGRRYLAVYLGVMGPQDGVDLVLRATDVLVHRMGRDDLHVALLGFGDCFDDLVGLAGQLGVSDRVTFTGRADARTIAGYLSAAHVGICPDPKNPLNDVSTMNKTMEYMAYALPVVTFDLTETRVSAGDAACYLDPCPPPEDAERFAKAIADLLDDPAAREEMGVAARHRAVRELDWEPQRRRYVEVYDRLFGLASRRWPDPGARPDRPDAGSDSGSDSASDAGSEAVPGGWGRPLVDLADPAALRRFARTRRTGADDAGD
ncbi:MAG TPA: glycosyltransferase family 4 protein, partial [Mycobacteriales bacterium]|nr:glycosyltransferase family 4 protein [Mycobacteriales bacterium]